MPDAKALARPPVLSLVTGGVLLIAAFVIAGQRQPGMDSAVYQSGALAVLHGQPLYESLHIPSPWADLPFTYPPIAALLFLPLAPLPLHGTWGVMAAISALALGVTVRVSLVSLLTKRPPEWLLNLLVLIPIGLQPIWSTIGLGQVNLLLMAMILLDVLAFKGKRYGGVLIGAAAAIKLTPLIFIPHLILTRRHADAARAAGTFIVLQGLGWLVLPADSLRFFTGAMVAGNGNRTFEAANQSINGLVQRLSGEAPDAFAISLALAVTCLAVHAILVRALDHHGQHLAALLVTAFCGLVISPVTWTHHWVWVVPLCLLLGYRVYVGRHRGTAPAGSGNRRGLSPHGLAAAGSLLIVLLTFSIDFRLFVPIGDRLELGWTMLETLVGNAYLLAAAMVGLVGAVLVATHRPAALGGRMPSQRQPEEPVLTTPRPW
ncbi:MAG TPA: glycosyltransferase 87 family protein [Candidatus Limnocylindrales bacterium]|nr:glycosyltransferase 87 family protein [Candidatus Limnocylindrales bacterium]